MATKKINPLRFGSASKPDFLLAEKNIVLSIVYIRFLLKTFHFVGGKANDRVVTSPGGRKRKTVRKLNEYCYT